MHGLSLLGSHSLNYFEAIMSWPGLREPHFISMGYVDDTQFVRFDSSAENPRVESQLPWMQQVKQEYWDEETQDAKKSAQIYSQNLKNLRGYYNQSEAGE